MTTNPVGGNGVQPGHLRTSQEEKTPESSEKSEGENFDIIAIKKAELFIKSLQQNSSLKKEVSFDPSTVINKSTSRKIQKRWSCIVQNDKDDEKLATQKNGFNSSGIISTPTPKKIQRRSGIVQSERSEEPTTSPCDETVQKEVAEAPDSSSMKKSYYPGAPRRHSIVPSSSFRAAFPRSDKKA